LGAAFIILDLMWR